MVSAALPAEFRCFRHITHIYARNLPLRGVETEVEEDPDDGNENNIHSKTNNTVSSGVRNFDIVDNVTPSSIVRRGCRTEMKQQCVSSYFVLSLSPANSEELILSEGLKRVISERDRRIYISEVQRHTQHPVWRHIPDEITKEFGRITQFVFSLYYCTTHPEEAIAAPDTDFLSYEMLIQTSHVQYVAPSMTKADALPNLPYHVDNGQNSFVILLRCIDGVFFPMHQGVQVDEGGTVIDASGSPILQEIGNNFSIQLETPTDVINRSRGRSSLNGVENITIGDLKSFATATLAWQYLTKLATERRKEQQNIIDNLAEERKKEAAVAAQQAMLEAYLAKANENVEQQSCELNELRKRHKEEEELVKSQLLQLNKLQNNIQNRENNNFNSYNEYNEEEINENNRRVVNEVPAEQELMLAAVRSQLNNARELRMRELRTLFPLKISINGIKDTICGHRLPLRSKETTATVELMREWGLALGCAAHLISTISTIYGYTLPHPLLLSGSRCCVLTRPGLSVTSVITPCSGLNDVKFPLYCLRVADRPLMSAGMQLMFADIASLAKVMGRQEIALEATEGESPLGVILNKLLLPM